MTPYLLYFDKLLIKLKANTKLQDPVACSLHVVNQNKIPLQTCCISAVNI